LELKVNFAGNCNYTSKQLVSNSIRAPKIGRHSVTGQHLDQLPYTEGAFRKPTSIKYVRDIR